MHPSVRRLPALLLLLLLAAPALALPPPPAVPVPLEPWVPWVLHEHRDLLCASLGAERACVWPGHLTVRIDQGGGGFELDVWLDRKTEVALPGDAKSWPQLVTVDGLPALVLADPAGMPYVPLEPGHHRVGGKLRWASPPEVLPVPAAIGVVELTLAGERVEPVRRDDEGRLFLQHEGRQADEIDTLTATVARRLQDGVPLRSTTRLTLRIAGRARDLVLGKVLPAGARPVAVSSELPVQVGPDGAVRVHGRPGQYTVDVEAVHPQPQLRLAVPKLEGEFWEAQEVWVWLPAEAVRSVELSGLQPVDPERTQLAPDWKGGRTFLGTPGQALQLKETRRGETDTPPNRVDVARELWLDLDGRGLTARDHLAGELYQAWRLDVAPAVQLGRVAGGPERAPHLITLDPKTKRAGVELRQGHVDLEADSRLEQSEGPLRIVGWHLDAHSLRATLHLPPGWELVGARGVDQMPQTWLDSWTLFDFFFVLMLALGSGKLLGWRWGLVALFGLALGHGEPDAPEWLWLNALAALALVRVLPPGWFRRLVVAYHGLAIVLLIVALVPFARDQLRLGLHPQVEHGGPGAMQGAYPGRDVTGRFADKAADLPAATPAAPPPEAAAGAELEAMQQEAQPSGALDELSSGITLGRRAEKKEAAKAKGWSYDQRQLQQIDPNAVVQTGPGVPSWRWSQWNLGWSGPVDADHEVELWLLSPGVNLVLAFLRVLLVVLLGLRLLDLDRLRALAARLRPPPGVAVLLLALSLTVGLGLAALPAQALDKGDTPPPDVLAELQQRLVAAQQCQGPCVVAANLDLRVAGQDVEVVAEVHAERPAGWALPGPAETLLVREVLVDGAPTWELRRLPGGLLAVRVPQGRHVVTVRGQLVRRQVLTLQLDPEARPKQVRFQSADWTIDGLDPDGVPDASLQLTRKAERGAEGVAVPRDATPGDAEDAGAELPPWFGIERHLQLALPWQVRTVVRRNNAERPHLVKVPLLAGEAVITDGIRVENGPDGARLALVHFPRDVAEVAFDSELPVTAALALRAAEGQPWTETWRLTCSPIFRCSWTGLPPVHTRDPQDGALRPLWQPWPGEQLAIAVVRPEGAPGQAVTVDRVDYRVTPGQRLLQAVLTLQVRTSQGGWQKLTLPKGAEVQSVQIRGQDRNVRPRGRELRLPLEPGEQAIVVKWQQEWARNGHETLPALDLGGPAANVQLGIALGEDRWLLWAHGPDWGPAVLFWSHLLLLVLAAVLLGRLQGPPLRTHHWLLLFLGLAQLPAPLALVVVLWFVALAWRRRYGEDGPPLHAAWHDLVQIGLVVLTLLALGILYGAIHQNLLLDIDMQVRGAGSSERLLQWYVDRVPGPVPEAGIVSLPLWVYRVAMLLWALWLVWALLKWLPWAWRAFAAGGLWRKVPPLQRKVAPIPPPPPRGDIPPPPGG